MLMRRRWIVLSSVVLLPIIALVVLYLSINSMARAGVEEGGKWALGVDTHVASAGVSLMRGRLSLDDVTVDNPKGYRSALFCRSMRTDIDVKRGLLLTKVLDIPRVEADGIEVNMEAKPEQYNATGVIKAFDGIPTVPKTDNDGK
jgi:hypothetical protein